MRSKLTKACGLAKTNIRDYKDYLTPGFQEVKGDKELVLPLGKPSLLFSSSRYCTSLCVDT